MYGECSGVSKHSQETRDFTICASSSFLFRPAFSLVELVDALLNVSCDAGGRFAMLIFLPPIAYRRTIQLTADGDRSWPHPRVPYGCSMRATRDKTHVVRSTRSFVRWAPFGSGFVPGSTRFYRVLGLHSVWVTLSLLEHVATHCATQVRLLILFALQVVNIFCR